MVIYFPHLLGPFGQPLVPRVFLLQLVDADPRWPSDEDVLRPKTPVFLALNESFDPDPSRMLTQEQANRMETYARLYSDRTKSGNRRRPRPK